MAILCLSMLVVFFSNSAEMKTRCTVYSCPKNYAAVSVHHNSTKFEPYSERFNNYVHSLLNNTH